MLTDAGLVAAAHFHRVLAYVSKWGGVTESGIMSASSVRVRAADLYPHTVAGYWNKSVDGCVALGLSCGSALLCLLSEMNRW